jgi:hypothetical protein
LISEYVAGRTPRCMPIAKYFERVSWMVELDHYP